MSPIKYQKTKNSTSLIDKSWENTQALRKLPDTATLKAYEACIFLRINYRTLQKLRDKKILHLRFREGISRGEYLVGELRDYLNSHSCGSRACDPDSLPMHSDIIEALTQIHAEDRETI